MSKWNWADVFETIAAATPDAPAQVCGDRRFSWSDFDRRANALAADLLAAGIGEQGKVAAYLTNCPEYLETYYAAFKAGLVPLNTNFRYGPEEIRYLFENADAEAVIFHASYGPVLEEIRHQLPLVKRWYVVDDPEPTGAPDPACRSEESTVGPGDEVGPAAFDAGATRPDWAVPYENVVGVVDPLSAPTKAPWGRSGDHLLFLYTGGTTGMPKGVMWRQDDLFNVLGSGGNALSGRPPVDSLEMLSAQTTNPPTTAPVILPACPVMHGTGQFSAMIALAMGGCVVTNPLRSFDSAQLFDLVEQEHVAQIVIVGDAFARPLLAALDANPNRWNFSELKVISSSGVMWSQETKDALLEHLPEVILFDSFGSSEAVGLGASVSTKGNAQKTAKFALGPTVHVFDDDNVRVNPGDERIGFVALSGFVPLGYYKDPEKTAKTFRVIDGVRYSVPGDYAQVTEDGTLALLGRGSVCINTGGEKVFPEEVEEVVKLHDSINDAVCVGIPDDRFGEVICAVVEPFNGAAIDADAVIEHVRARLARYKSPRHVVVIDTIGRAANGKVDYKRLTAHAREVLNI
jgi:3-oxocholest-4-en-26-oate---CoA ligase